MKRIPTLIAFALMILGGQAAGAQTVTTDDHGMTVVETVTTPKYGTVTIKWLADANFAASVRPGSPYWVPGINPNGSMPLSVAAEFIDKLNEQAYLRITNWSLPITMYDDSTCSYSSAGGRFGYDCGENVPGNTGYPYSELAQLFYTVLGGQAHANIKQIHGPNYFLFRNLQPYLYWSSTMQYNNSHFGNDFWFQNGFQGTEDEYDSMFVLPVSVTTTGTVPATTPTCGATPETCTDLLPGLGLTTTIGHSKRTLQVSRDGTLVYDPTLNVTFLTNANLAGTLPTTSQYYVSGINPDGSMNLAALTNFLAALNNPANPYLGLTGWTVPMIAEDGLNANCTIPGKNGNSDFGYNCNGPASQLGELFYDQLGGLAGHEIRRDAPDWDDRSFRDDWSFSHDRDDRIFNHLMSDYYWQCRPTSNDVPGQCAPARGNGEPSFSFLSGYEGSQTFPNDLFVILVVPGDAIPGTKRW